MKNPKLWIAGISMLSASAAMAGSLLGPYSVTVSGSPNQLDPNGQQYSLTRWYKLYVPATPVNPAPLVIVLHGGNANYTEVLNSLLIAPTTLWATTSFSHWKQPYPSNTSNQSIADKFGIIVAVPNGTNGSSTNFPGSSDPADARFGATQHWNDCSGFNAGFPLDSNGQHPSYTVDDVSFISKMIVDIQSRYTIDSKRIFVAGASNGGNMALRLARELPNTIAAVAATLADDGAGAYTSPTPNTLTVSDSCQNANSQSARVPIWMLKGDQDSFITYNGGCNQPGTGKGDGCWMPYEPNAAGNLPSGGITTISRTLTRYGYGANPVTGADAFYYHINNLFDNSSTVSCKIYYGSGVAGVLSRSDIEDCIASNAGHDDPSVEQHLSSSTQSTFGNQNWDIETAVEEWMFFYNHPRP